MITIKNKKFAESEQEFVDSLFESGGTCTGYAKRYKRQIVLMDHQKNKIGVINRFGCICKATLTNDDKYWYSYGNIDSIGELSHDQRYNIVDGLKVKKNWGKSEIEYWFK